MRSCPPLELARSRSAAVSPTRASAVVGNAAIFAGNDEMAYGVMEAAEDLGLRIPDDLALAGFDDITPSAHMRPPLTTVRQPFYEMGQQAISLLLSLLEASRTRISPSFQALRLFASDLPFRAPDPI